MSRSNEQFLPGGVCVSWTVLENEDERGRDDVLVLLDDVGMVLGDVREKGQGLSVIIKTIAFTLTWRALRSLYEVWLLMLDAMPVMITLLSLACSWANLWLYGWMVIVLTNIGTSLTM